MASATRPSVARYSAYWLCASADDGLSAMPCVNSRSAAGQSQSSSSLMWPTAMCASARFGSILSACSRGALRLGHRLDPVRAEQQIRIRQAGIGQRIVRILGDRLLEVLDRLLVAGDRALVPVIAALQVRLIRHGIVGVALRDLLAFLAAQARLDLVENLAGNLILHGEQVGGRAVVLIAPQLRSIRDVHQLGLDDQPIAADGDVAGDDGPDVECRGRPAARPCLCSCSETRRFGR